MPARESSFTVSSGSDHIIFLNEGDRIAPSGRSVHSPASTESQSGHSSADSWAHIERTEYDPIKPSDSASRSRRTSRAPAPAPLPPTRRHSSRSAAPEETVRYTSHRSRSSRHRRGESRRIPSDESTSTLASGDDYPYGGMPPPQQRGYYRHVHPPSSHAGYPPTVSGASPYADPFAQQSLVHMPTDAFGYPVSNPFSAGQPNPFAPIPHGAATAGYFPPEAVQAPRPHPTQRMSMYAAPPPQFGPDMHYAQVMPHQGYPMYPPMGYMQPASPAPSEAPSNTKEFESLREIIKKHEEERLAWEKAMVLKAEADAAARAAEETKKLEEAKKKDEIAFASAKAKEAAETKAAADALKVKDEVDKKLAEAKKAKEDAEKKSKELEEEKKKNAPAPDASKEPIKFKDAGNRKFSFPWAICKTWKGMKSLVEQAFAHVEPFAIHVMEGRYDLIGPDGEIILPQVWETTVKPGWEVVMVMWPMDELEPLRSGKDAFGGFNLDELMAGMGGIGGKPSKAGKAAKAGKKEKGKRNSMAGPIPVPPQHENIFPPELAHLWPAGAMVVEDKHKPTKAGSSSKSKAKDLPPLMRWMYGGQAPKKK